ncbi:hypothetical protein AYO40_06740 [Planctomycetaceae bacterium SCGC AG-212-D15]|nr:hypothetical protein AYO40_06740 [Planctomycetaceae bacterium SCGC AG-212-D15]
MMRWTRGRLLCGLFSAVCLLAPARTHAAPPPPLETRVFRVHVDQKPAGEYRMVIRQDGETASMSAQAEVRVRVLLISYVYTFKSSEVWKGDSLARLDSNTVDDKKRFSVTAWTDKNALRVRVNGQEHTTTPDAWTTTYWRLPGARFRNRAVPLLDADTGKDMKGTLRYVGMENVPVAGQTVQCAHWRVTGDVQVDAWYDGYDRLVREESVEEGHKTLLDLIQVTH